MNTFLKKHTAIPLYFNPEEAENGAMFAFSFAPCEGFHLLCKDTLQDFREELPEMGDLKVMVFDTQSHAQAANSGVAANASSVTSTLVGKASNGHGLLLMANDQYEFSINAAQDCRSEKISGNDMISFSVFFEKEEFEEISSHTETRNPMAIAEVLNDMARSAGTDVVKELQIRLERHPGAYISFLSRCLDDLSTYGQTVSEENTSEAHALILRESQKMELSFAQEAVDDVVADSIDEIMEENPDDTPQSPTF